MTNGAQPQPPQKKKGISPIAWIAIGCVGLIVIAGLVLMAGGLFVAKKGADFAREIQEDPGAASRKLAEMAIRMNPDYEIVETNDDEGTITFRDERSGEVTTMNFQDIADGKFSVTDEDGKTSTMSFGADGIEARSGDGEDEVSSFNVFGGGADTENVPEAVLFSGASDLSATFTQKSATAASGMINYSTDASLEEVVEWYEESLEGCSVNRVDAMGIRNATLDCAGGDTVSLIFSETSDGGLKVVVNYSLKSGG